MKCVILSIALGGYLAACGHAAAQSKPLKEQIVGTWTLATLESTAADGTKSKPYGEHPLGVYIFEPDGRFYQIIDNPDRDASNINYFGTYDVDEGGKGFTLHIRASSARRFIGTDGKRDVIAIADDTLQLHNPTPSLGGSAESTWKRLK